MTRKKRKSKQQIPQIRQKTKHVNPPTIIADNIYSLDDAEALANLNIFTLVVQGTFPELFTTLNEHTYYKFYTDETELCSYAVLDVSEFLKTFDIESDVKLILSRSEILTIHHIRVVNNDIILSTNESNIPLSIVMQEILDKQEKHYQKTLRN